MATETGVNPTVGDIEPCPTCGHVKEPAKRLHEIVCCGLDSHVVDLSFSIYTLHHQLAHGWRGDDGKIIWYSAVRSGRDICETDALAWLEFAHNGRVTRRQYHEGKVMEYDAWDDQPARHIAETGGDER